MIMIQLRNLLYIRISGHGGQNFMSKWIENMLTFFRYITVSDLV